MRIAVSILLVAALVACKGQNGSDAPSSKSDEARLLELHEEKAAALKRTDQSCKSLGEVIAAHEKLHEAEVTAILARTRDLKAAGKTPDPMTDEETLRFQQTKAVIVAAYQKCVEDPEFAAALHAK